MASPALPLAMRAWTHIRAGTPSSVLTLSPSVHLPTISSPNHVLVQVTHAALNPGASIMMQLCPFVFRSRPGVPELDFSGRIVAAGSGVAATRNLQPGTPVFGSVTVGPHLSSGAGALAEYVAIDAATVVRKPDGASFEEAAGLGVAGCTALILVEKAGLKKGDSVLVNGASGGLGHMVVQMVKEKVGETGRVVGVCSGGNAEMVRTLGADEAIDYQIHTPVHQFLGGRFSSTRFSAIIDAHGSQDIFDHCPDYLAEGKPYVTVGPALKDYTVSVMISAVLLMVKNGLWPRALGGVPRDYVQVVSVANLEAMEMLVKLVEEKKLRVVVDSCSNMEDALKAYERILSRRARGKVIVKVQSP